MQAYSYEPITGLYSGPISIDASPMEPGVYLVPAFATDQQPPATQPNEIACFDVASNTWGVQLIQQADAEPDPLPFTSVDQRNRAFRDYVSDAANATAVACGFESLADAVSYADEPAEPSFQALGRALRAWRSVLWAAFNAKLDELNSGTAPVPSKEALLAMMPAFVPPEG